MPTYEYQCTDCGTRFEVRATMEERAKGLQPDCPTCGSTRAVAVLSVVAIGGGHAAPSFGCCSGSAGCGPPRGRS